MFKIIFKSVHITFSAMHTLKNYSQIDLFDCNVNENIFIYFQSLHASTVNENMKVQNYSLP